MRPQGGATPLPAPGPLLRGRDALPEIALRGLGLHAISEIECVEHVQRELAAGRGGWIVTPNLDHLRRFTRDPEFRALCEEADVRVADGMVLVWACTLQRTPLPERVAGSDLIASLARGAAEAGRSVFLLGGNEGTDVAAARVLGERHPALRVAGTACPPPGFERDPGAVETLAATLRAARPDVVFVALGSPKQERLIHRLRRELPGAWWLGVGISFSFLCGDVRRAPRWMQRSGLEWMHRLAQEPRRLFRRYVVQGLPFAGLLLLRAGLRGMLPKGRRASRFGPRRPRVLLVDDDPFALDHLELLLASRFDELVIEKRDQPDARGEFDFYFLDDDFGGERLAARLAAEVRARTPGARVFAFSAALDVATLKGLINAGCDGACDKDDPTSWGPVLASVEERLGELALRHGRETGAFGGVRHAASSIEGLLRDWNERQRRSA